MQTPDARCQTPDAPVLVCFALKEEAAPFRKSAAGKSGISILIAGIGCKNAEKSLREFLASNSPKLVLTCGFAGGLNPDLKLGEVVFEMPDLNSERPAPNCGILQKLLAVGAKPVKFFCADRIAITVAEKKKLCEETGADAVEMESEAIHAVCRERGISCATVRVISDTAKEDLPLDFNKLTKADLGLNYRKLALVVAKSPQTIGALIKLQKRTRTAAEKLAEILSKIIAP
jgi:adenosylhomocysteine nucleosidase